MPSILEPAIVIPRTRQGRHFILKLLRHQREPHWNQLLDHRHSRRLLRILTPHLLHQCLFSFDSFSNIFYTLHILGLLLLFCDFFVETIKASVRPWIKFQLSLGFSRMTLCNADLRGADLTGAILPDTATGIGNFYGNKYNGSTRLPFD